MKKSITAAALLLALSSSTAFAVGSSNGIINFKGSVVEASCGLAPGEDDQTVDLGEVTTASLVNGGTSDPEAFDVVLQGCDGTATTAAFTFVATPWTEDADMWTIPQNPTVGLSVQSGTGTPMVPNVATDIPLLNQQGDITLPFTAQMVGAATGAIQTGQFQLASNFVVAYN